jgi:hypothetical protein
MFSMEAFYRFADSNLLKSVFPCVRVVAGDLRRAHVRFYEDDRELMRAITPLLMLDNNCDILVVAQDSQVAEELFTKLVDTLSYLNLKKVVPQYRRMDFVNGPRIYVTHPKSCNGVRGTLLQEVFIHQAVITQ